MEEYQPKPGEVVVREQSVTDQWGAQHLSHIRVTVRVRVPHEVALVAQRRFPEALVYFTLDKYGRTAEIEVPLMLTDEDVRPYLEWRDKMLARVLSPEP
jgi:hypothetical protein